MKVITVIPARGGSKSIPNKNIQLLGPKPLVAYSIEYSLSSIQVSKTVVSTDSSEIADISKSLGAEVPFLRPAKYATDKSRDYEFMRHALDYFEGLGEVYDLYVLLRPTSPVRPKDLIERAIQVFLEHPDASSVRSVALVNEHPFRAWTLSSDGLMSGFVDVIKEPYNVPRQELPSVYFQTGDIEVVTRKTILSGSISGCAVYPVVIDHSEMLDIDHWADFSKAIKVLES